MTTPRTPVSKKTSTTKKAASSAALPEQTAKGVPKARAKTPSAPASKPVPPKQAPVPPKQTGVTKHATATGKPRAPRKSPIKKNVTPGERYNMIAAAAYFLAERHGFSSGRALDDWVAAEKEIDCMLKS